MFIFKCNYTCAYVYANVHIVLLIMFVQRSWLGTADGDLFLLISIACNY